MRPISVRRPVATTTADPLPPVTAVPRQTMLSRSASGASKPTASSDFITGRLSPVSIASFTDRSCARRMRASASTAWSRDSASRSPGTTSAAGTVTCRPSRTTCADPAGPSSPRIVRSARLSTVNPIAPFKPRTAPIAAASASPPVNTDSAAAPASSRVGSVRNWSTRIVRVSRDSVRGSRFGPASRNRRCASDDASPPARPPTSASTESIERACQSAFASGLANSPDAIASARASSAA